MRLCKCGCGGEIPNHWILKEYLIGHKKHNCLPNHLPNRSYSKNRKCACGCGFPLHDFNRSLYKRGHKPIKPILEKESIYCKCGCGQECKRLYIKGHHSPEEKEKRRIRFTTLLKKNWSKKNYRKKLSGKNHYKWINDKSKKKYCTEFTKEFKKDIKKWDNNQCRNPHCLDGSLLSVHHIDYNRLNCHPLNTITLCRACNSRANYARSFWKSMYLEIRRNDFYNGG